ncbi:hypothetical protein [Flavobacterium piscinae]|uniref:hypothetical protein n=1 Tax=Flavobacterium piscinae TaxID=2506424 RepID=UPI002AAA9474|nr:hypothetical protein [Flavobacterium piscinae]
MEENYTLAKWLNNELEGEELKAFEASEDFAVYQKIKQYSGELTTPAFDDDKMLQTILQRKKNKTISIQKSCFASHDCFYSRFRNHVCREKFYEFHRVFGKWSHHSLCTAG